MLCSNLGSSTVGQLSFIETGKLELREVTYFIHLAGRCQKRCQNPRSLSHGWCYFLGGSMVMYSLHQGPLGQRLVNDPGRAEIKSIWKLQDNCGDENRLLSPMWPNQNLSGIALGSGIFAHTSQHCGDFKALILLDPRSESPDVICDCHRLHVFKQNCQV